MSSTTTKLPGFMRKTTPAKFKALSKEDQRAHSQKSQAWLDKFNAQIDQKALVDYRAFAVGLAGLVANARSLEFGDYPQLPSTGRQVSGGKRFF